jgi:two-component system response regulator
LLDDQKRNVLISDLAVPRASRWILIVEDNPDDERLARRVISMINRPECLKTAQDGEEALKILQTEEDTPTLILLDLKLPRLSGVEVLMAIKDDPRLTVVPVVILTSSDEKSDRSACYELGCNAFVRKPMDYELYIKELTIMLQFWLDVNLTA